MLALKNFDWKTLSLVGGVLVLLGIASAVVYLLKKRADSGPDAAVIETFRLRVRSWLVLYTLPAAACRRNRGSNRACRRPRCRWPRAETGSAGAAHGPAAHPACASCHPFAEAWAA